MRITFHVVTFGAVETIIPSHLEGIINEKIAEPLGFSFNFKDSHFSLLEGYYNEIRRQYPSTPYLRTLMAIDTMDLSSIRLGIASCDLYSDKHPSLNFIFGEAQVNGICALISTYRLHPEFYGMKFNKGLYLLRVSKEALHELGHIFGLVHCKKKLCVMYFSNSIYDTDLKRDLYCMDCFLRLDKNVTKRFKKM
ncbi:MAG: archaemetzincin family Zn-dependent metalloprotease [Promethearchaeota archaeon]